MKQNKGEGKKREYRYYLYMYKPFKLMVGKLTGDFIPRVGSCDWYYLNYWQTFKYLLTGKLPH
jgi:hypothetical protein